ncbi:MAG: beta-lactamase family protein [Mitsuaria chitosanitabida]|uniref:serine hydrolase domain-containing protein n=1 Tax=Roseateles chitosanitabidus TaxID=65048 RepID=UPI001B203E9B|nr:serine hydrolase domain-containing protein [Roseateles chitosanitabidus]MBO9687635.1 beta-lactamase family protein [Roseateles chitosanitabidus]
MSQPLEAIMRDRVFRPLGMTRSSFVWTPSVQEALIPGAKVNGAPREAWPLKQGVAAFSLYTTAEDYAHFVLAVLTDRELLQTIELAPIDVEADLNLAWGLGWGIERTSSGRYLWQWGNNPGYRAFVMLRPASGDAVILLSSGEGGLSIAKPVVQDALPDEHRVFQWSMLQPDGLDLMCRYVRLCW